MIEEISTEPEIIYAGSTFLLKVKVQDGMTWNQLKAITWGDADDYTYAQLKGE